MDVHQPAAMAGPEIAGFLHSSTEHASPIRLDQAVNGLRRMQPEWSASQTVTPAQRRTLTAICIAGIVVWIAAPIVAKGLAISLLALAFAMVTLVRFLALWQFVRPKTVRGRHGWRDAGT